MTLPISPASQADVFAGANPLCDRRSTVGPGEEFREGPRWAGRRQLGGKYLPRVVSPYLFNGVGNKMVSLFSELLTEEKKKKKTSSFSQKIREWHRCSYFCLAIDRSLTWPTVVHISVSPSSNSTTQLLTTATSKPLFSPVIAGSHRLEGSQPCPKLGWATAGFSEPCPVKLIEPSTRLFFITAKTHCCHICVELLRFVKASIHSSRDLNHPCAMGFPYPPGSDKMAYKLPSSLVLTTNSIWDLRKFSQLKFHWNWYVPMESFSLN